MVLMRMHVGSVARPKCAMAKVSEGDTRQKTKERTRRGERWRRRRLTEAWTNGLHAKADHVLELEGGACVPRGDVSQEKRREERKERMRGRASRKGACTRDEKRKKGRES